MWTHCFNEITFRSHNSSRVYQKSSKNYQRFVCVSSTCNWSPLVLEPLVLISNHIPVVVRYKFYNAWFVSQRINVFRIAPALFKECANKDMVPFILPSLFLVAEQCTNDEYVTHLLPGLKPLLGMTDPVQVLVRHAPAARLHAATRNDRPHAGTCASRICCPSSNRHSE